MALFQRKPQVASSIPAYTIGATRSLLIIGLGNPDKKFEGTRHNVGFEVLDDFAARHEFGDWIDKKNLLCRTSEATIGDARVILCKPTTFMNDSGQAAAAIQHFYKLYNHQTLVIYDELAMPFGSLRSRFGGSDAGHNGVKSLIAHIGDDFGRLRIGVANDKTAGQDTAKFVLAKFSSPEKQKLPLVIKEAAAMLSEFIHSGQLPADTRSVL